MSDNTDYSNDKEEVVSRWESCKKVYDEQYEQCKEDWEFLHGVNQWEGKARESRVKSKRPHLTLNQLLPYANQVVNDIRQANIAIRVSPVDDEADVDTAEIFQGIIRNIERQSGANMAYSSAALNAIGSGVGWIKLSTQYADPMSFNQEIVIDRVLDFTSVYLDPSSNELDGRDAEFGFIKRDYTKDEFKELYPDAQPISFEQNEVREDNVCVVEYYSKHYETFNIYLIELVDGLERIITQEEKDRLDEKNEELEFPVEYVIIDERETRIPYVKHCVYNGEDEPLEEESFPCKYIPLVPVIGAEVFIEQKREFHSLIRQAKDAQRMYNYASSASIEMLALQPKAPWIAPHGSFASFPNKWSAANIENFSFLEYDLVYDENGQRAEPPQRQISPPGSPALMQESIKARDDIRLAIGIPDANMGMAGNQVSGVALRNKQIEGDNANFHFMDNLASSITQVGRILIDMIPRLYDKAMVMRIIGDDGQEKPVPVNQPFVKKDGDIRPASKGEEIDGIYALNAGKYDVVCDVGASYSSKRQETADKLIELVRAKPELADVTADLLFEALDLPKGKEIADRLRANMDPAMLGDDPQAAKLKEAAQMVQKLQEQLEMYDVALQEKKKDAEFEKTVKVKELEQESEKIQIDAQKAMADIQKTQAEIEKMRAETTGFNMDAVAALGNAVSGLSAQVNDIGQAMEIMFDAKEAEGFEATDVNTATSEPVESVAQPLEGEI